MKTILLYLRHVGILFRDVIAYCLVNRTVLPLVLVVILLLVAFLTVATYTAVPFLYTVF